MNGPTITRDELFELLADIPGTTEIVVDVDDDLMGVMLDATDVADAIEQETAPSFDLTTTGATITRDELLAALADAPGDTHLLAYSRRIEDYVNLTLSAEIVADAVLGGDPFLVLTAVDDFDTRQW